MLLSGDHKKIDLWRLSEAVKITRERRPELLLLHPEYEAALEPKKPKRRKRKTDGAPHEGDTENSKQN